MDELKEKIKNWHDGLNQRERYMVYVAAVALLIFIPYQFIWAPFSNSITDMQENVARQKQDLLWMQESLPVIRQLNRSGAKTPTSGSALYSVVQNTASRKFGTDIRVEKQGRQGIRVMIDNAGFDDLMSWLDELISRHQARIKEFNVNRKEGAGRVKVSIVLES